MTIDDATRERWRSVTNAATAGPWERAPWISAHYLIGPHPDGGRIKIGEPSREVDATFIATGRAAMPAYDAALTAAHADCAHWHEAFGRQAERLDEARAEVARLRAVLASCPAADCWECGGVVCPECYGEGVIFERGVE